MEEVREEGGGGCETGGGDPGAALGADLRTVIHNFSKFAFPNGERRVTFVSHRSIDMRSILLLASFLSGTFSIAQIQTTFVTPPTSGCNGVWGVQVTSLYCTSSSPYTFVMEPSGCLQLNGWTTDQSTMLIPLCAIPCSLTVTTADSVTCSGSTSDAPIGITEVQEIQFRISLQGEMIELVSSTPLLKPIIRVVDISGRLHHTSILPSGDRWRIPAPGAPGVYFLVTESDGASSVNRFATGQ